MFRLGACFTANNETIDPNSLMWSSFSCLLLERANNESAKDLRGWNWGIWQGCGSESRTDTGTPIVRQASTLRGFISYLSRSKSKQKWMLHMSEFGSIVSLLAGMQTFLFFTIFVFICIRGMFLRQKPVGRGLTDVREGRKNITRYARRFKSMRPRSLMKGDKLG